MSKKRDFLRLSDFARSELHALLDHASTLKKQRQHGVREKSLEGRGVALVFEKASTRTRLSFAAAIAELGGHALDLDAKTSQMGRGEPLADTARVLSRYADAILFRTSTSARLHEFASAATVPVINGLSDDAHPLQLLADLQTLCDHFGDVKGRTFVFVGDGSSNMARSYCEAAPLFGFTLRVVCPEAFSPPQMEVDASCTHIERDPKTASRGVDAIITDVFTSMGQEAEADARRRAFDGFIVDAELLKKAPDHAVVLHCLPAHRGEEIAADVLESPRALVWDEAENRMHTAKALLAKLLQAS